MREGIAIVGLNGSGKSTLAHALAKELGFFEIDCEDYYFPEQRESRQSALEENYDVQCSYLGDTPYSVARSKDEVEQAIAKDVVLHPQYIISGVTMNWNEDILSTIKVVFWLKTETAERVKRVKSREEKRWGSRVSVGGDMYEQQLSFRNLISGLPESMVEDSISKIGCEVRELDGMLPISRNLEIIQEYLQQ